MITKNFLTNAASCRELFFSEDLPPAELDKYQALLRNNASPVPVIDVSNYILLRPVQNDFWESFFRSMLYGIEVSANVHVECSSEQCSGVTCSYGAWVQVAKMKEEVPLPLPPNNHPPAFVLGGNKDLIVDTQALKESAEVYGVQPVILKDAAHDIMLVKFTFI